MPTKPKHVSSKPEVATVRFTHYWGSLLRHQENGSHVGTSERLQSFIKETVSTSPTPRDSYLVEFRSYNHKSDSYTEWRKVARYNHLGLEIAL